MSEESTTPDLVELVRGAYEASNRRDFDAMMNVYGRDSVWEDFAIHVDTTRIYGDAVIVRLAFTGHARASGVEVSGGMFSLSKFHDFLFTRIEDFVHRDDALKALGASG